VRRTGEPRGDYLDLVANRKEPSSDSPAVRGSTPARRRGELGLDTWLLGGGPIEGFAGSPLEQRILLRSCPG
jgi:hypothetical protein